MSLRDTLQIELRRTEYQTSLVARIPPPRPFLADLSLLSWRLFLSGWNSLLGRTGWCCCVMYIVLISTNRECCVIEMSLRRCHISHITFHYPVLSFSLTAVMTSNILWTRLQLISVTLLMLIIPGRPEQIRKLNSALN